MREVQKNKIDIESESESESSLDVETPKASKIMNFRYSKNLVTKKQTFVKAKLDHKVLSSQISTQNKNQEKQKVIVAKVSDSSSEEEQIKYAPIKEKKITTDLNILVSNRTNSP